MASRYPDSRGSASKNRDSAHPKAPKFKGHLKVTPEQMVNLRDMGLAGEDPRLQIAVWAEKDQETGETYLSFEAEAYISKSVEQWRGQNKSAPPAPKPVPPPVKDDISFGDGDDLDSLFD